MSGNVELVNAIRIRSAMESYQDTVYMKVIRQLNEDRKELTTENWGREFVKNCGRDLAGEIVRNFFNTSNYYISADQLAKRMLTFSYDNDYNPLAENGKEEMIRKNVYSNNEILSSRLDDINQVMSESQEKLFTEARSKDKLDREKKNWRETQRDENGDLHDDLTGEKGDSSTREKNGKEYETSNLHADHIQSREAATVNARYIHEDGAQKLREFYNSDANFQLIHASANSSKGDVRVCIIDGKIKNYNTKDQEYIDAVAKDSSVDITYKATPEQLADAICEQWEKETPSGKKVEELKKHGYLDENGKVTKSVRKELERNIRRSQNEESKVILQETDYGQVAIDSLEYTTQSFWKIVAGQILYYAAPPIIYEIKVILIDKNISLDNALEKITKAGKRVCEYVYSNLKTIFTNILENSLKTFIKSFMDILINMVKATVQKLLKMAKNLILSTVDAVRVLMDKTTDATHKADAIFNLYSITITTCVVDIIFEFIKYECHLPEWLLAPLQVLTTVVCTNLTMLILRKADLFDVNCGFKMAQIRKLFEDTNNVYEQQFQLAMAAANYRIEEIINEAKNECLVIYENLEEFDIRNTSVRNDIEKINVMFSVGIKFESDWLKFIGVV